MGTSPVLFMLWFSLWSAESVAADSLSTVEVKAAAPSRPPVAAEFSAAFQPKPKEISLGRALERRAGVARSLVTSSEGQEPQFLVRGLAPVQQRFFLEGIPLFDSAFDQSQLSWIAQESISGVDFYPDGVPWSLAADGLGSAFQMRWRAFESCENDLNLKGGSFGYGRVAAQSCLEPTHKMAARVAVSRSDEGYLYREDNGLPLSPELHTWERRRENGFYDISMSPSFVLPDGSLRAIGLNRWLNKSVPGPVSAPRMGTLSQHSHALLLFWAPVSSPLKTSLALKWDDTVMKFTDTRFASPVPSRSETVSLGVKGSSNLLTTGATLEVLRSEDARLGTLNARRWDVPLGIGAKFKIGALSFFPAVQSQAYGFDGAGATGVVKAEFSPRLGLEIPWGQGVTSRLSIGKFYRLPNLSERYGSANGLSPNPELKSESALKASLSNHFAVYRGWRGSLEVAAIQASDLIAYETTSPQSQTARNLGAAQLWYGEVAAEADLPLDLTLRSALELLVSHNQEFGVNYGNELPFRPRVRFRPSLSHESDRWSVGYEVEFSGPQFWDVANLKSSEGFWQHNIRVSHRHRSWGTFTVELLNLSDLTQVPTQSGNFSNVEFSTGYRGFPAPGRRGYLSWSYAF